MTNYKAPLDEFRFIMNEVLDAPGVLGGIGKFQAAGYDIATANAILETGATFSETSMFPLNASGDHEGCTHDPVTGRVTTPQGFKKAYDEFRASGLGGVSCGTEYGGMGLPNTLSTAVTEMMCGSNLSLSMYFLLTRGQIDALEEYAPEELKAMLLPKLISGEWAGTMCLTEPDAGSDVGRAKTRATQQPDGTWTSEGTKIFISAGDHDLAENISHLVLARTDDPANPQGTKGLSLFSILKFLPDEKGGVGAANALSVGKIEHKMGIRANATCVMNFEGAKGYLVSIKGMPAMFVMMNAARIGVGVQGVGLSELAFQNALPYAQDRKQGTDIAQVPPTGKSVAIIEHPAVREMLMTMKSETEAGRMLSLFATMQLDLAKSHPDAAEKKKAQDLLDFLTPVVKAHLTDNAVKHANLCVQIHGGMGFIEETGVAQIARDARITTIYEGTNEIQALDFMFRKTLIQGLAPGFVAQAKADVQAARAGGLDPAITEPVQKAAETFENIANALRMGAGMKQMGLKMLPPTATEEEKDAAAKTYSAELKDDAAKAGDFLHLASLVAMGQMWVKMSDTARQRLAETPDNKAFYETKIESARFYMEKILGPEVQYCVARLGTGVRSICAIANDNFAHEQGSVGLNARPAPKPAGP